MGRTNRKRDRWLKKALELILRPWFRRPAMTVEQIKAQRPQRVLIVRQHNQMGDMICAVPAFRAIRESFPEARSCIVTAPVNDGVVRGHPYLDEVLLFDKVQLRRSPRAVWRLLRQLRSFDPDLALVLNSVSFSGTSAWIAVLSGAPRIIGGDSRPFGWSFSDWLYNVVMPSSPELLGHAIDHSLDPLAAVGIGTDDRSTLLVPGEEARRRAHAFLRGLGPRPWMAVHPGAGKIANRWPASRFAAAAKAMESEGASLLLVEGPADGEATGEMLAAMGGQRPVLRGADVATLGAVLAQCDLALVNDTGVMHVAGAVGAATLALFGPTRADSWKPPSAAVQAIQSEDGRMDSIDTELVLRRLREMLRTGSTP